MSTEWRNQQLERPREFAERVLDFLTSVDESSRSAVRAAAPRPRVRRGLTGDERRVGSHVQFFESVGRHANPPQGR